MSRPQTKENILTVVKSYAQIICPKVKTIQIKATDNPALTGKFYFEETLERKGKDWEALPLKKTQTAEKLRKNTTPFFVIRVATQGKKDFSFADVPYPIKIDKNLSKGWWLINGSLKQMDDFEKKKSKQRLKEEKMK